MRTNLHDHFEMEGAFSGAELKDRDRNPEGSALKRNPASASPTRSQISLPSTPGVDSSGQSRQGSSEISSEIAPEIVVWTEDMDFDDMSQHDSDGSAPMDIHDE